MEFTKKDLMAKAKDKTAVVPSVLGYHCPVCQECEFSGNEGERFSEAVEN